MGIFSLYNAKRDQIDSEKRQVGYEKDSSLRNAEYRAEAEQTTNTLIESRSDLQKWQQLLKEDFDTLIAQLGYEEKNGTIVAIKNCIIVCNEKCINYLKSVLTPFYFRSVSITKLDKTQINCMMLETMSSVTIDLSSHKEEYAIKNTAGLKRIAIIVENIIMPILCRSIDGFTKKEDSGARKIVEDATGRTDQNQSIFKRLAGMA